MSMAVKTKPITSTPVVKGRFAKEVIKEANSIPSKVALLRVKRIMRLMDKISK